MIEKLMFKLGWIKKENFETAWKAWQNTDDRLTRAKTMLMLECSRLPESSRKSAFKAEIEAL